MIILELLGWTFIPGAMICLLVIQMLQVGAVITLNKLAGYNADGTEITSKKDVKLHKNVQ